MNALKSSYFLAALSCCLTFSVFADFGDILVPTAIGAGIGGAAGGGRGAGIGAGVGLGVGLMSSAARERRNRDYYGYDYYDQEPEEVVYRRPRRVVYVDEPREYREERQAEDFDEESSLSEPDEPADME